MHIPYTSLQADTLRALIEQFVLREGTEYGAADVPLKDKVAAVQAQLADGRAHIVYDAETETCDVVPNRTR